MKAAAMQYDPALDGMRAVAVAAVVVYHLDAALLPGGWAGVDVFFVLSGFLITTILQRELNATGTVGLKRFYIRRALRLTPALLAMLVSMTVVAIAFGQFRRAVAATLFSLTYTMNWVRALGFGPQWALGHSWSLAMEEQFYLLWPAVMLWARPAWRFPVTLALIGLVIAWRAYLATHGATDERTYNGFDTHADALLIGCVLAIVGVPRRLPGAGAWSAVAVCGLAVLFTSAPLHSMTTQTIGLSLAAVLSSLAVVCARQEGWLRRVLSLPPLVFTGRISYGLYLWHYPLIVLFAPLLPKTLAPLLVVAAYLLAILSFYTVEAYFGRLKNRLDSAAYGFAGVKRRPVEPSAGPLIPSGGSPDRP